LRLARLVRGVPLPDTGPWGFLAAGEPTQDLRRVQDRVSKSRATVHERELPAFATARARLRARRV